MNLNTFNIKTVNQQFSINSEIDDKDIAVICYGHLRSFLYALPTTLSSISKIGNPHIYMHTWDNLDSEIGKEFNDNKYIDLPQIIRSICNKFNLVSLQIDSQNSLDKFFDKTTFPKANISYMYYSKWAANQLKKQVENRLLMRYKRCIKIRPDIKIEESIGDLDIKKEYFFMGFNKSHPDIVALTSSKNMDNICSFIKSIDIKKKQEEVQKDYINYMENILKLKQSTLTYGKDWNIIRLSYFNESDNL